MSRTIRLKRSTEMVIPHSGHLGRGPQKHTFPEGTPVLYSRINRPATQAHGPDGVDHKISIRWEGDLYERYLMRAPGEI